MRKTYFIAIVTAHALFSTPYASSDPDASSDPVNDALKRDIRSITADPRSYVVSPTTMKKPSRMSRLCALLSCMGRTAVDVIRVTAAAKGDPRLNNIADITDVGVHAAGVMAADDDLTLSDIIAGTGGAAANILAQAGEERVGGIVGSVTNQAAALVKRNGLDNGLPTDGGRALGLDVFRVGLVETYKNLGITRTRIARAESGVITPPNTPEGAAESVAMTSFGTTGGVRTLDTLTEVSLETDTD